MKKTQVILIAFSLLLSFVSCNSYAGKTNNNAYLPITDIFPPQAECHTHGSNIVYFNNSLMTVWFHGDGERTANNVKINASVLSPMTGSWSTPFEVAYNGTGYPAINPALMVTENANGKVDNLSLYWMKIYYHDWGGAEIHKRDATVAKTMPLSVKSFKWQEAKDGKVVHITYPDNFTQQIFDEFKNCWPLKDGKFNPAGMTEQQKIDMYVKICELLNIKPNVEQFKKTTGTIDAVLTGVYTAFTLYVVVDTELTTLNPSSKFFNLGWETRSNIMKIQLPDGRSRLLLPVYSDHSNISMVAYSDEVGASCILLEIENKKILLDCGMRMKKDPLPDFQTIKNIGQLDAVILSHAHMDHSGTLPIISSEFPFAKIWMTPPTEAITKVLLYDSLKIMDTEGEIPKYNKKQVEGFFKQVETSGFITPFKPFGNSEIKVTFYPAGHILGAASIYIESNEGTLFYSGDISLTAQRTISSFSIPKLHPDICILESTYGNRMHSNRKIEENRLIETISEILKEEGRVLIPAFAVGRAQEVILTLRSAINRGIISKDTKIYVDGMVREICNIYRSFPNYLNESLAKRIWHGTDVFFSETIIPVTSNDERTKIINDKTPCCIISSSGMLTGGPSSLYAEKLAEDENSFICITGYQDEESPGRKLQELCNESEQEKQWIINSNNVKFNCKTGTYSLSAHADKNELINIVEHMKPKEVFLVHGDSASITSLGSEMQLKCRTYVHAPKLGDTFTFKKFHGKRFTKQLPPSLKNSNILDDKALKKISEYLLSKNLPGPWTVNDLLQIHGLKTIDSITESTATENLNNSSYFKYDLKRLYLFFAVKPENISSAATRMEVNQMLARAAELFPTSTGLYKRGARIESGTVLFSFRFPDVAKEKYAKHFEIFEKETGWSVELNKQPDTSYLRPLLAEFLGKDASFLGKIAWHLDKNEVHANFPHLPENIDSIKETFYQTTYLNLIPITPETKTSTNSVSTDLPGGTPVNSNNKYNRTEAVDMIKDVFEPSEVQIYKYSIKSDAAGEYIELQFLTPSLGKKHQNWTDDLKEMTGWRIAVSQNPRQQDIIAIARAILQSNNITILKGPSIHSAESKVSAKVLQQPDTSITEQINNEFKEKTGFSMEVKF